MAAQRAADLGATVAGIDAAALLLDISRERSPAGDFRVGDLEDLPFPDHAFDVVTGFNAFQFAGNPVRALTEARRETKPGGVVAVMTWAAPKAWRRPRSSRRCALCCPPRHPAHPVPSPCLTRTAFRPLSHRQA